MSEEWWWAAGEDCCLRNQVKPPALEESNSDPLEHFTTRAWSLMKGECREKTRGGKRTISFKHSRTSAGHKSWTEVQRPALVDPPSNIPKLTLQKFKEGVVDMSPSWKHSKWQWEQDDGQKGNGLCIPEPHIVSRNDSCISLVCGATKCLWGSEPNFAVPLSSVYRNLKEEGLRTVIWPK